MPTHGAVYVGAVSSGDRLSAKDGFIERLVSFLVRSIYRDVVVHAPETLRSDRPRVIVSNHFGGFADALVLLAVLPDRPGIVARDVIWKNPVAAVGMNWLDAIPVHKPDDHGGASSNDQMFSSCYEALEQGRDILIFPEGVTRREPSMAPVKTGASRIALGARSSGVERLEILPIGIHYEDKASLRSRIFVNIGSPLRLDELVDDGRFGDGVDPDASDRDSVRALNDDIETAMRRAAPDYEDWTEARLLADAAEVTLRTLADDPAADVGIGMRDRLANTLADRPEEARSRICAATATYRDELDALGTDDAELAARVGAGRFVRSLVVQVLLGVLLAPFALAGAVINALPFLAVRVVGRFRVSPSVLATVKPLVAVGTFGLAWGVVSWLALRWFGWEAMLVAFVLLPVYLAAALVFGERLLMLGRLVRRRRADRVASSITDEVVAHRGAIVEAVRAA